MFEITKEQQIKIDLWLKQQDKFALESQKLLMSEQEFEDLTCGGKHPYCGAISGGIQYTFIPTSIGTICKIKHSLTNKELDITDYDIW
jgi:hypothetical protein